MNPNIEKSYALAKEQYAQLGVDTDVALKELEKYSISIHCWQGDDVGGFETPDAELSGGGIQVTGNYPGKARNIPELQADLEKVYSLVPGNHRLNLHAIYGDFKGKKIDRDEISTEHFDGWIEWAKTNNLFLDFNATCFSHPKADSGLTLSSKDASVRNFWIKHIKLCREISAYMGEKLGSPAVHNLWIPDGFKDIPVDRLIYRKILSDALDEIFAVEYDKNLMKDSIESKLFGIGSEAYVVGSHEFYMGYGISRNKMVCLDMGHFHPTETIADKISAVMLFSDELMFHISRGVRWDSDHVVILNDDLKAVTEEIIRLNVPERVNIGLDFFDASINRIGAWVTGTRSTLKAMLNALLEPQKTLVELEDKGDYFGRLALLNEFNNLPSGAVWDYYCAQKGVPTGTAWIDEIQTYEKQVLSKRS